MDNYCSECVYYVNGWPEYGARCLSPHIGLEDDAISVTSVTCSSACSTQRIGKSPEFCGREGLYWRKK